MKLKRILSNNILMAGYVFRYTPRYAWLSVAASVLVAADNIIGNALLINFLYDALANRMPLGTVLLVLAGVGTLLTVRYLLRAFVEEDLKPRAQVQLRGRLQQGLYSKAVGLDLACYDDPAFYDSFVWAVSQAEERAFAVFETVQRLFSCLLMFLGYLGVMIWLDPWIILPAALFFAVSLFLNARRAQVEYRQEEEKKPYQRQRDYAFRVFYLERYAKELRLSHIGEVLLRDFAAAVEQLKKLCLKYGKKMAGLSMADEFVCEALILNGGVYGRLAYALLVARSITVGNMMSLAFSAENIIWRTKDLIQCASDLGKHALYIERFRAFLAYKSKLHSGSLRPQQGAIELKNVTFSYRPQTPPVLKDFNLTVRPGEKLAVVGENGAGKSTLVKLLLHLYDPIQGSVCLAGRDIRTLDLHQYRAQIGAVFQDYQIFAATVGENVALDRLTGAEAPGIRQALQKAGLGDWLNALPQELETQLTKEFDDAGAQPSGGQAQKLAIARLLYRNVPILILDEPSSALDPISEYQLNRMIQEISRDKTVLFISHRLSATVGADRIILLEGGKIAESGTHAELLAKGGKYAGMWQAQAQNYAIEPPALEK